MSRWVLVLVALAAMVLPAGAVPERPNILFIVADDLGYGEPGCYGGDNPTPHIDSLAAGGVRFTSGYVTAPFCAPSRAALLTGRYGTRFGFEFNPIGAQNALPGVGLPVSEQTTADALRGVGYATGIVGKWHLGGTPPFHPQRRGFDEYFGFLHEGHFYVPPPWTDHVTWLRHKALPDGSKGRWSSPDGHVVWSTDLDSDEPPYDADNPLLLNSQPVAEKENLTDAFTREAIHFIDRHESQPFFLYLAYNAVHSPMQASEGYLRRFTSIDDIHRRIFAAMLSQLDDGIGRVLNELQARGLAERTLVIFLSDNGGPTKELTSSNKPLRGGKGELYEGGVRIPMILRWPGHLIAGRAEPRMASSLDLVATMLAAAGAPTRAKLDGVNLAPLLTTWLEEPIRPEHFWRVGKQAALRSEDWKLVRPRANAPWQLYDLSSDLSETNDLAAAQPDKVHELEVRWNAWNAEQSAPAWRP